MPGFWGSHLGIVDLDLEVDEGRWTVVGGSGSLRAIYKRDGRQRIPLVDADPAIVAAVAAEHEATIDYMNEGVGETTAPINSYFALVADDPSIQIVTNAQKWYVERIVRGTEYEGIPILSAGAPFKAGGRQGADYYTVLEPGDIALKNVADLYIYPNTLRVVKLNGAQVREWLEMSAGQFNQIDPAAGGEQVLINTGFPSYNFDVIDGVSYRIDVTKPARYNREGEVVSQDHRIVDLSFEGQAGDRGHGVPRRHQQLPRQRRRQLPRGSTARRSLSRPRTKTAPCWPTTSSTRSPSTPRPMATGPSRPSAARPR